MHQPVHHSVMSFYVFSNIFFSLKSIYLFIYLAAQGPDQGSNPGPLHGEHRILVTGPQEVLTIFFFS